MLRISIWSDPNHVDPLVFSQQFAAKEGNTKSTLFQPFPRSASIYRLPRTARLLPRCLYLTVAASLLLSSAMRTRPFLFSGAHVVVHKHAL